MYFSAVIGEADGSAQDGHDNWLLCRAGSFVCALPLTNVIEIMRILRIEPIADAPDFVRGLAIIRGVATPVVDIAHLFGGSPAAPHRLVTVKAGTRVVALAVDSVLGVRSMDTAGITEALPPLLRDAASDMVSAIGRLDADLLFFLNTAGIVPEALFDRLICPETVA
jgi:purine-binding chemotaxis protein CheW